MSSRRFAPIPFVVVALAGAASLLPSASAGAHDSAPIPIEVEYEVYDFAVPDTTLLVRIVGETRGELVAQVIDGAFDVRSEHAVPIDSRTLGILRQQLLDPELAELADAVVEGGCERGRSTALRVRTEQEVVNLVAHSCAENAGTVEAAIGAAVDPVLAEAFVLIALGADSVAPAGEQQGLTMTYRFNDASVPPEYHRSYELTVDGTAARLVVDSYGEVLHDESVTLDQALLATLRQDAALVAIPSFPNVGGCTGGTSESLRIVVDGATVQDAFVDNCGSVGDAPAASRAIGALVGPLLARFDLDHLLATAD